MADYLPQATGNWSTTTWITAFSNLTAFAGGNTPPTFIDDVYADGKTITIDIDTRVRTLLTSTTPRTGGLTGGGFRINNAVSLSANLSAGTTDCLTFLSAVPNFCTIVGNLTSSATTQGARALNNNSSGTINVFGNILGGVANIAYGCLNNSTGTINLVGTTRGRVPGSNQTGIFNNSTGTINITGIAFSGGDPNNAGVFNNSSGIVNISGICISTGFGGYGIRNNSTGIINFIGNVPNGGLGLGIFNVSTGVVNVTGDIYGGTGSNGFGVNNSSVGVINIIGNTIGGSGANSPGVNNSSNGVVLITGNVIAGTGTTAFGANNAATGYLEVNGLAIGNGFGIDSAGINSSQGIFGSQTGTTIIRGLSCGPRGQWPTAGVVLIRPESTSTATLETSAFQDVTLITSLSDGIVPPVSSVRQGTVYNLGDYRGTCAIPSVSSVLQGVAVDNSIGIAALRPQTIWNYSVLSATDVNSLGGRLKDVATVQSVGQQLTALN